MYSKTGNTVDSAVNQALHQGGVANPLGAGHQGVSGQGLQGQGLVGQQGHLGQGQGLVGQIESHLPQGHLGQGHLGQGQGLVGQQGHLGQGQGLVGQIESHLPQGHLGQGHLGQGQGLIGHGGVGQVLSQGLPGQQGGFQGQGFPGQGLVGQGQGVNPSMTQDQTYGHTSLGTVSGFVGQGVSTGLGHHQPTVLPSHHVDPQVHGHGKGAALGAGAVAGTGAGLAAHHAGKTGAGKNTITFRPIEARFTHDKDILGKMDPYCKFKIGMHRGKSAVAKGQGTAPVWNDSVTVKHKNQEFAKLKVKDHDKLRLDDTIGTAKIPLDQVLSQGRVDTWVPVSKGDTVTGEVHLIIESSAFGTTGLGTTGAGYGPTSTVGTGHHTTAGTVGTGHHTTAI